MDGFVLYYLYLWPAMLVVLIGSWIWFAFTKSKRVRWLLVSAWWMLGMLSAISRPSDEPFLINIIAYPLGVVLASLFWAFVFQGIGWIGVRAWRFLKPKVLSLVRDIR